MGDTGVGRRGQRKRGAGGREEEEEGGEGDRCVFQVGRCAALIREPINATILRQSIIIFPICIATELLFKSAPPVSTPLATPCKSCPGRQRDSSSGTPYRFCYAVGFFSVPGIHVQSPCWGWVGDNLRVLFKSRGGFRFVFACARARARRMLIFSARSRILIWRPAASRDFSFGYWTELSGKIFRATVWELKYQQILK